MKKLTVLITFIITLIFLYSKVGFQLSKSSEYVGSNSSSELVGGVVSKTKLRDEQLEETGSHIDTSSEVKYLKSGIGARFDKSDDLYALALELYDLAKSGNSEAQFYLALAMAYCRSPDIPSSEIDSALTLELHDWMRIRCAGFINQDIGHLGKIKGWIELSAKDKYPQALVASLMMKEELPRTSIVLNDLQLALSSKNSQVMNLLGDLAQSQKNKITREAWRFLACDYGHDCSAQSKAIWRLWAGASCSMQMMNGQECKTNIDYFTYSKSNFTSVEFEQILNKVAFLKDAIESDRINELTFKQILN